MSLIKGYVNYSIFNQWSNKGIFFVTRINDNANYTIIESKISNINDYAGGGIIKDEIIELKSCSQTPLKARLITYKDPLTGKVLKFLSNTML